MKTAEVIIRLLFWLAVSVAAVLVVGWIMKDPEHG